VPGALHPTPGSPFVGRSGELRTLRLAWQHALGGARGVALIEGEAGAGKSRLAREFASHVMTHGGVVLFGACDAALASPYQPFVEALQHVVDHLEPAALEAAAGPRGGELRRLFPNVGGREPVPSDPDTERYRLHVAVADLLAGLGRRGGVLLVLDDLHWADAPTLLLLRHLARPAAGARLLVVGTVRAPRTGPAPALEDAFADLRGRDGAARIELGGLSPGEVAEFVRRAAPGVAADELSTATGGNAFLVGEMCRHLARRPAAPLDQAGIPRSVREVVGQRLSTLAPETRDVLELLSLSGRALDIRVLREAAGERFAAAVDEGVGCGLLEEVPAAFVSYRFRHDLLRHAVRDRMSGARAVALHLRVAEALARVHATDSERVVSDLAFHFAVAGSERAVEFALRAAGAALRSLAFLDAARHLETALELGVADPRRRARTQLHLGTAFHRAGHAQQALDSFAAAGRLAREIGDAALLADAAIGFETACWPPGLGDERAVPHLEQAAAAVDAHDASLRVRLLAHLSRALAYRGDHDAAGERWRQAVALARSVDDRQGLAVALFHAGWTRGSRSLAAVRADIAEACELALAVGDETLHVEATAFLLTVLIEDFALEEARSLLQAFRTGAERAGQPFYLHGAHYTAATIAVCDGRLADAEAMAERARELSRQLDHPPSGVYGIQMFTIRREQDRLAEIAPLVRMIGAGGDAWGPALAVLLAEIGELDAARLELERLAAAAIPPGPLWLAAHAYLADACVAVGDAALAAHIYARLVPFAGQNVVVGQALACYGAVDRFLAALATTMEDWEAAEHHGEAALALNAGLPIWLAYSRYERARALSRRRDPRARAERQAALADARRLRLAALTRRIEGLAAPVSAAGLSARELDTLRLIAGGLSNREIGGRLFISEHTAAKHVRSIFAKTGCTNRTEAASFAHRHGLVDVTSPKG
jgi:DNA-binding CsgD family transcriptional regulator/tetratricopeptide (TPR) repeat protein